MWRSIGGRGGLGQLHLPCRKGSATSIINRAPQCCAHSWLCTAVWNHLSLDQNDEWRTGAGKTDWVWPQQVGIQVCATSEYHRACTPAPLLPQHDGAWLDKHPDRRGEVTPITTKTRGEVTPVTPKTQGVVTSVTTKTRGEVTPVTTKQREEVTPVTTSRGGEVTPVTTKERRGATTVATTEEPDLLYEPSSNQPACSWEGFANSTLNCQ